MEKDILELIQIFDNNDLKINIIDNVICFTINSKDYYVTIKVKNNLITFIPNNDNLETTHFCEILNSSNVCNPNNILELIEFITNLNLYNYCIVCHKLLDFQTTTYVPCVDSECHYKYEELIINNPVTEKFKDDPVICKFLIKSALEVIYSTTKYDRFEPFPRYFLKYKIHGIKRGAVGKIDGIDYDSAKDFEKIESILSNFDIDKFKKYMSQVKNDQELSELLGKELYILIRFILMSCSVTIIKNDMSLEIKNDKFKIYKIIHTPDKEEEFQNMDGIKSYLFHGSKWCNWYSILRNGLKNCSNTKLMSAGAACGNGIYLSDNVGVSTGYGLSGNKSVIGVFEAINAKQYWKTDRIYVIDNEKVLIQRYLLILPYKYIHEISHEINQLFNTTIHEKKINTLAKYTKKSLLKINKEYKQLIKYNEQNNGIFKIMVNHDYPFEWKIFLTKFDDKTNIAQDMKKYNINEIELELRFPENYPFSPPFLRVVRPRFKHLTAHITSDGAFCQEILTEKGWVPTCSIESLITIIMTEIVEGDGRLDPQAYHIPYSFEKSKESFYRVAKSHGWL